MKVDAYMQLFSGLKLSPTGTVGGEALDEMFPHAIQIHSFSLGSADSTEVVEKEEKQTGTKGQSPYAPFGFKVTKELDTSSAYLFRAYAWTYSGQPATKKQNRFPKAVLTFRKTGEREPVVYLIMTFENVVVTSWGLGVKESGEPDEDVSFRFQKVLMTYIPQEKTGTADAPREEKGWDFSTNRLI
jgi:type VI protein secretion system component Hcp